MAALLSDVLAQTRTFLNDDSASVWTDPVLIPKIAQAHLELQTDLWAVGSPVVRSVGTTAGGSPADDLPDDFLCPIQLITTINAKAIFMTEVFYLETLAAQGIVAGAFWSWRDEQLYTQGETGSITILYRRKIAVPVTAGDDIGIQFGELYLAPRAAAYANLAAGNAAAADAMAKLAETNFAKVVAAHRGQQKPMFKP